MTCARRPAGARTPVPSTSTGSQWPDARTGRARARRLSLLPVLALLLGALSPFAAAPAAAQAQITVWSATLTADVDVTGLVFGCDNDDSSQDNCSLATVLTDDDFEYGGITYSIVGLYWDSLNNLALQVAAGGSALSGSATKTALGALTLNVQGNAFAISGSETATAEVQFQYTPAAAWTDGLAVSVSLTRPASTATDATLSDLSASTSTSTRGLFTSLDIGTFASGTTSYRGSVGNPVTHVKLTPTVNDFGATVKVGKQGATLATVASGSASGAIPLSLGSNAITVEVTAPDRTTTQTYTVTVTRLGAAAVATVTLSASPAQVWEGQVSRVTATLSHALPHGVLIPVTVTPCPEGSWCKRFNNYGILITAGDTVGHLRGPVDPSAAKLTNVVVDAGVLHALYTGPQTSLLTVRDADAEHEEVTVALGSPLPKNVRAGGKTSQKVTVLDPDGFAMTLTADRQPAEGGGVVRVTVDLGQPAPPGFFAKINSSASTAKFGYGLDRGYQADWTMDGKVQIEEPYVAAGPVLPRPTSSTRGPCVQYRAQACSRYISADDWNNRDWQRMHYLKDWNGASKKTFTIQIADDDFVDPGETIVLQGIGYIYATGIDHGGSGFSKGQVQSNELTLTIKDNDGGAAADAPILMSALPTIARESGTGDDTTARMPVVLNRPATQKVSVTYSTSNNTATLADYTSISETTLTFEPGETRKEIEITIKDDEVEDSGESFAVFLSNPTPASVVRLAPDLEARFGFTYVTIINDEADLEGLKLWGAPGSGGPYARLDLGAFDGAVSDYAVTVPHGTTHAKLAGIAPQNEHLGLEAGRAGSELTAVRSNVAGPAVPLAVGDTVLVVQSTASTGERKTYRVTVTRQERPAVAVSLSATPNPVDEGAAVTVRATLATALAEAVTIPLTVTRGTSEDGDHGSLASITIPAGGTSATGTITTVEDDDGDDETFTVALGTLPAGLAAGSASSVEVTITDGGAQQQSTEPLTAAFEGIPSEHDGTAFTFDLTLSEAPGAGNLPVAASFKVAPGKASVSGSGTRYTVTVTPKPANAWKDVTITLLQPADCAVSGAICTADGRALSNSASATVGGPVRIRIEGARAREGKDESLDFAVTLNRAADHAVSVDYATEDGTAAAGADYTATSGTLTFAAGETAKTVSVPLLDDAIDEGKEVMRLLLSNPRGAYLRNVHRQAKGVIRNADPLPKAYLGHFGRRAASDAVAAVTARFETPRGAGSHLTFAGQRLSGDGAALADTVAGLARAFGAEEAAPGGDPWHDPASVPGRAMSGRELLTGTSFRAVLDQGAGAQLTSWGQGATVSHFSGAAPGLSLSGEAATGALGMDYERGRMLAGFALTHSLGAGTAQGSGETYALGSTVTTVLPYARLALTDRLSAWTLAGTGSGGLTLDAAAQRHRTDLSMTLAAAGMRGDLVPPTEAGGLALAVKADAFWVRTESNAVRTQGAGSLAAARADATRLRAVLDGKRRFALTGGRTLAPSLELGLRHDGGDAGTGTGMELGAGVGYTDRSRGLDMALRVYGLAAHAEDGRREWGVSGSVSLVPGGSGRGLSMSLTPSWGVDRGDAQRLWTLPDAHALAANDEAATPSSRLDTELGYGLPVFGGGFTGTPNVGFGLSETARDWRLGWRLTPAGSGDTGFEVSLDATRRETANDDAEHGVMVRGAMRW